MNEPNQNFHLSLINRERAKVILPLLEAYSEGATIQRYSKTLGKWLDEEYPFFDPAWEWRVKPEGDK